MFSKVLVSALLASAVSVVSLGSAQASAILGSLWINDSNSGNASIVPAGTPDATFNPGAINYDSRVTNYTLAGFLNNPTFNNQSSAFVTNGGGGASVDNTFIQITGTVGLNAGANSFVVEHDDGVVLTIQGIGAVVNQPGPTAPTTTPFTVTAPTKGNYNFTLNYTECCGPPAVLVWKINNVQVGVPEPATWSMMILGVAAVGYTLRRRRMQAAFAA
ncbi:MAG TPA: PEPxxWA-CTERM sorting domain-containing protein [Caulobacteraceae bacterium]|nr:PEPxxWA-CTERM sorting domain-containing protein [Caulobacteraceae bacterium]